MYNSRSNRYNEQVLQPTRDDASERSHRSSIAANAAEPTKEPIREPTREPTPSIQRRKKRKRNIRPNVEEEEEEEETEVNEVPNSLYKRAVYDDPDTKKFIKKATWAKLPDALAKQTRNIMTVHYQNTLEKIASSSDNHISGELEQNLRKIARGINQNIKTLLVPGTVDKNLLDPSIRTLKDKLLEGLEPQKKKIAYNSLILKKKREALDEKMIELSNAQIKLRETKRQVENVPIQSSNKLQDYAQSLIVEPSYKISESPK